MRHLIGTTRYLLDSEAPYAVLVGKVVQVIDGDAHVLLEDGRTVVRDARWGLFADYEAAEAVAVELAC